MSKQVEEVRKSMQVMEIEFNKLEILKKEQIEMME